MHLFNPGEGLALVNPRSLLVIRLDFPVSDNQIRPDDHADIFDLQTLACVDTTDFLDRVRTYDP